MKLFRELNKKGYKHYYGGTIEELDSMDKNNPDLHSEIMQVIMWLYEKHGIWITVTSISQESWQCHMTKKGDSLGKCYLEDFYSPTEAYQEAIKYTLTKLI